MFTQLIEFIKKNKYPFFVLGFVVFLLTINFVIGLFYNQEPDSTGIPGTEDNEQVIPTLKPVVSDSIENIELPDVSPIVINLTQKFDISQERADLLNNRQPLIYSYSLRNVEEASRILDISQVQQNSVARYTGTVSSTNSFITEYLDLINRELPANNKETFRLRKSVDSKEIQQLGDEYTNLHYGDGNTMQTSYYLYFGNYIVTSTSGPIYFIFLERLDSEDTTRVFFPNFFPENFIIEGEKNVTPGTKTFDLTTYNDIEFETAFLNIDSDRFTPESFVFSEGFTFTYVVDPSSTLFFPLVSKEAQVESEVLRNLRDIDLYFTTKE